MMAITAMYAEEIGMTSEKLKNYVYYWPMKVFIVPLKEEEIEWNKLVELFQESYYMHPFTCGNCKNTLKGEVIEGEKYLTCNCGYKQLPEEFHKEIIIKGATIRQYEIEMGIMATE